MNLYHRKRTFDTRYKTNGRIHLIEHFSSEPLCGCSAKELLDKGNEIRTNGGRLFEFTPSLEVAIDKPESQGYCKRCVRIAINI